jgi:hypothetical protein
MQTNHLPEGRLPGRAYAPLLIETPVRWLRNSPIATTTICSEL